MKVTKELLAAYAEGNVSGEERKAVRQYLIENPAELESVMIMMDKDYELEPKESDFTAERIKTRSISFKGSSARTDGSTYNNTACVLSQEMLLRKMMSEKQIDSFENRVDDLLSEIDG